MTYAVALDGRYISINWCIKYKSVLHCLCQDASARAPLPVTVHQLGGTMWNDVRVCYLPPREREREQSRSFDGTPSPLTDYSREPLDPSSLFLCHPSTITREDLTTRLTRGFLLPTCLSLYLRTSWPRVLFSYDKYIYIHDFNDTSIAVGRLQLFSPSHCHRALLYPSDETLLTNSPVGRHKERRRRKRERERRRTPRLRHRFHRGCITSHGRI